MTNRDCPITFSNGAKKLVRHRAAEYMARSCNGKTASAHFGPSATYTKSSATRSSPKLAGNANRETACVMVRTYFRKAATSPWAFEKYGGATRVTKSENLRCGCSAMFHAAVYEPSADSPSMR